MYLRAVVKNEELRGRTELFRPRQALAATVQFDRGQAEHGPTLQILNVYLARNRPPGGLRGREGLISMNRGGITSQRRVTQLEDWPLAHEPDSTQNPPPPGTRLSVTSCTLI
jgi:hypothetical protein